MWLDSPERWQAQGSLWQDEKWVALPAIGSAYRLRRSPAFNWGQEAHLSNSVMQAVAHCSAGDQGAHSFKFQSVINTKIENVVAIVRECDLLNAFDTNLHGEVLWRPDLFETAGEVQGLLPWLGEVDIL